ASPVKFAEYLAAGLEVIISENLGDYSKYVIENNVGMILSSNPSLSKLLKPDLTQKKRIMELAKKDFLKENYRELYFKLLS
ncbi:MAG: glycosyl transferase, partial [Bacteroidetes bacterium]|nr:glycosyl transferase [Bacteroidota bacterium]